MAPGLNKDELKQAVKEGVQAWMDDRFKQFGRHIATSIGVALFGYLIYWLVSLPGGVTIKLH
jgi:hypothetical protein